MNFFGKRRNVRSDVAVSRVLPFTVDYPPKGETPTSFEKPKHDCMDLKMKSFSSNSQNTWNTNRRRLSSPPAFKQLCNSVPACIVEIAEPLGDNLKGNNYGLFKRSSPSPISKFHQKSTGDASPDCKRSSDLVLSSDVDCDMEEEESIYEDSEDNIYQSTSSSYPLHTSGDRLNLPGRAFRIYEKGINLVSSYVTKKPKSKNKNLRDNDCQSFSGELPFHFSRDSPAADNPNNKTKIFHGDSLFNNEILDDKLKSEKRKGPYIEPYFDLV